MVVAQIQLKFKEVEGKVRKWMSEQSAPVEVAITAVASAVQGGAIGGLMGNLTQEAANVAPNPTMTAEASKTMQQLKALSGGPFQQARNFAVMTGVNAGITAAMKRSRGGVEDVQTSVAAAFGSGLAFSLISGLGSPVNPLGAIQTGAVFALVQGGLFKLGQRFVQPRVEDTSFVQTKSLLHSLGLDKYEKNFRKGLLTDETLPLLNDSALQEVRIPPGPRLLILDQLRR